jgi:uncharacterized protein YjbJ (UPF0337 family)
MHTAQRCVSVASSPIKEFTVNKDQVKGTAKDIGGKIQQEAGKLVGSSEQQAKGLNKQAEGKLQKGLGDAKEAVKDITKGNRN